MFHEPGGLAVGGVVVVGFSACAFCDDVAAGSLVEVTRPENSETPVVSAFTLAVRFWAGCASAGIATVSASAPVTTSTPIARAEA